VGRARQLRVSPVTYALINIAYFSTFKFQALIDNIFNNIGIYCYIFVILLVFNYSFVVLFVDSTFLNTGATFILILIFAFAGGNGIVFNLG